MKFICETFSRIGVIFREESNESSSTMIGYSDATVTVHNHALTMHLNVLLATAHATVPQLWRLIYN